MPSALILIANGTEEMEFTIAYDTLVRAGIACTSALVQETADAHPAPSPVAKCSRGMKIIADTDLGDLSDPEGFDVLIIPGGAKGAETLAGSRQVQTLVKWYFENKKIVGMICAGTLAAASAGLPNTLTVTSHPSVKGELDKAFTYSENDVVISDNLITSRGPGTAFLFALTIVEKVCGSEKRGEIYGPMVFPAGYYV